MQLELSDAERETLTRFLRSAIDADHCPLSPLLLPLRNQESDDEQRRDAASKAVKGSR
jgi:hypothetical protein